MPKKRLTHVGLGSLFLFVSSVNVYSNTSETLPCPSMTLSEWTEDASFMAYLNPAQAKALSNESIFCLPTKTTGDVVGVAQRVCMSHTPYTSEDMVESWISTMDQIVSDAELVEQQPVTPTVFREPTPEGSDCVSLPRVLSKPKYGAIIIQNRDGAIFAAPMQRDTYAAIKKMYK